MAHPTMVPFVKWVGGKRQILPALLSRLPRSFNFYYEPFIGAGALFLHLRPPRAVIGDTNGELITTYRVIKQKHLQLIQQLTWLELAHNEAFFNKVRELDRLPDSSRYFNVMQGAVSQAARFVYLNKTSFNGIYRVNSSGYYNTPSAKRLDARLFDLSNLEHIARYLKTAQVQIKCADFMLQLKTATRGDFVYLDPPYDYEIVNGGFDAFSKKAFGREGQLRLAQVCKVLDQRGVKFLLSNHDTAFVREAYAEFKIDVIEAPRLVGGKASRRLSAKEVLIRNYELDDDYV